MDEPQEPEATEPEQADTIPGVVDLTTKPVNAQGLKTTEDNWDDLVAFTTVTVMDGEDEIQTCYVRQSSYSMQGEDGTPEEFIRYELYDGLRLQWVMFVISDWIVKTRDGTYEAMDEGIVNTIYEMPAPT